MSHRSGSSRATAIRPTDVGIRPPSGSRPRPGRDRRADEAGGDARVTRLECGLSGRAERAPSPVDGDARLRLPGEAPGRRSPAGDDFVDAAGSELAAARTVEDLSECQPQACRPSAGRGIRLRGQRGGG